LKRKGQHISPKAKESSGEEVIEILTLILWEDQFYYFTSDALKYPQPGMAAKDTRAYPEEIHHGGWGTWATHPCLMLLARRTGSSSALIHFPGASEVCPRKKSPLPPQTIRAS